MKLKGSVTIFLSLILIIVMAVIGALLESSRLSVAKEIVLDHAYLSLQNILAEYQRELWDDYHIFFVDGTHFKGDEGAEKKANAYLRAMLNPENKSFTGEEAEFTRIGFYESMVEGDCKFFTKQVLAYMKMQAPKEILKHTVGEIEAGGRLIKGQMALQTVLKTKVKTERHLAGLQTIKEKIKKNYTDLEGDLKDLKDAGQKLNSPHDIKEIKKKAEKIKENFSKKKEELRDLSQEYEKEKNRGKEKIKAYKEEIDVHKDDLSAEDYKTLKKSIDLDFEEDVSQNDSLDKNEKRLNRIISLSEKEGVKSEELKKELAELKVSETKEKTEVAKKKLREYENTLREEENGEEKGSLVLELLGGRGIRVSEKKIKENRWKEYEESEAESLSLMEKGLFLLYMKKHFKQFEADKVKKTKPVLKKEALDYGLEYIALGNLSDQENLHGMAKRIFAVRSAVWFSYFLSRPDKVAEATQIATAAVGILGPVAVAAAKTAILLGQAAAEARKDVGRIFKGEKVEVHPGTPSIKMGYNQFLDLFLAAASKNWSRRSVRLIEQNMKLRYHKEFRADNCFSGLVAEVKTSVNPRFFRLKMVKELLANDLKLWEFEEQISESLSR